MIHNIVLCWVSKDATSRTQMERKTRRSKEVGVGSGSISGERGRLTDRRQYTHAAGVATGLATWLRPVGTGRMRRAAAIILVGSMRGNVCLP